MTESVTAAEPIVAPLARQTVERSRNQWLLAVRRSRQTQVGLLIVILVAVVAVLARVLGRYDPTYGDFAALLQRPSLSHPFGTDNFGRDVLARVLDGYRVSMIVAIVSVACAVAIGIPLGLLAGYFGGVIDNIIMRPLDLLMAFPTILLAVALITVFGTGITVEIAALALIYIPIKARVLRASAIVARNAEYVEAAKAMGATAPRIMLRHVLPNSLGPLVVQASISMGIAILIEASLSFIGLGTQPPDPSLGSMLSEGRDYMQDAPWIVIFPGLAIMLAVLGFNLLGDGLRDVFGGEAS